MQGSSMNNDQQSSTWFDALEKARRKCIRVVDNRLQNHTLGFTVRGEAENLWFVLLVDHGNHDKKELFLAPRPKGPCDISDYGHRVPGHIIFAGSGNAIPEDTSKKIKDLVKCFKDDFLLVRFQKKTCVQIFYVLSNPGKKQEIMRATSHKEISQHGRILYYTNNEDPPEALSIKIIQGQFILEDFIISDVKLAFMHNNGVDRNGWTVLHHAAYDGDLPSLQDAIKKGVDIHAKEKICGRKAVHIAVRESHIKAVEFLLNNGASVNETDKCGWTLLHYAVWKGNVAVVKFLIQNKPDINTKDKCMGKKPIHVAAEEGNVEIIQILLDNGAGVDDGDGSGRTPLYYSVWESCLEAAKYLVSRGANVNKGNIYCNKPIHIAADIDNKEMIGFLLSKGSGIEDKDKFGKTVLHRSASCGILNNVQYLVENGANLNAVDNDGKTPLALGKEHTEVATYLADKMQSMCVALYNQRQYGKALDILKDIYANSGLKCEHLDTLRTKCVLGLSISDAGASYNEAVEVLRDAFHLQEGRFPDSSNQNGANSILESIFTRSNCCMIFYFVIFAIIFRFIVSCFEPGAPI